MIQVSIILPIYNGEKTLANTLDSLMAQTYSDFEVIACVDGSTDDSEHILKLYALKFKKLTILKNKVNRGLGPTMNRLVHHAKGDYIAIAEQDDFYYPERLQLQVGILDKVSTVGLVSGIAEFCDGDIVHGKFPGVLVHGKQYPKGVEMFMFNYKEQIKVVNSCMMFRKSVHIDNGLYFTQHYPSVSVDWTYVLRFSLISDIYGINKVLVRLDRSPERTSVTSNKKKQFKATRELVRSFKYEYPNLIGEKDYNYALNTQRLLELGSKTKFIFLLGCLYYFLISLDRRFLFTLRKKTFKYLNIG